MTSTGDKERAQAAKITANAGTRRTGVKHRPRRTSRTLRTMLACGSALSLLLAVSPRLWAVQPGLWVQTAEADFSAGQNTDTVVTNLGDIKLSAGAKTIGEIPEQATILYDIQRLADGSIYLAGGPEAMLLTSRENKLASVLTLKNEQIFALDQWQGKLLVGISGEKSHLAVLEGNKLTDLHVLEDVRYIWDILVHENVILLATGAQGKLIAVDMTDPKAPKQETLLDAAQDNLLCLGKDGRGRIYAGTDSEGLVYRVSKNDKGAPESYVMLDAPEPEIGALLVLANGTVYAGTADAEQARPGRLAAAATTEGGRPEQPAIGAPEGEAPQPPEIPHVPPEPKPLEPGRLKDKPAPAEKPAAAPADKGAAPAADEPQADQELPPAGDDAQEQKQRKQAALPGRAPAALAQPAAVDKAQGDEPAPAAGAAEPAAGAADGQGEATPEQLDQLRSVIRQRLDTARQTGVLEGPGGPAPRPGMSRPALTVRPGMAAPSASAGGAAAKQGNAIYRIDEHGFVSEIFRESVMILKILQDHGTLLVGTGNEGQLFRVDPFAEETTILADFQAQQIPTLFLVAGAPADNGGKAAADKNAAANQNAENQGYVLAGTANPATLLQLGREFGREGTFTSTVLDAGQISLWGVLRVVLDVPVGASVELQTRSGNVEDPDDAAWSIWSKAQTLKHDPQAAELAPREMSIQSPPARFLQYRLTLRGDGQHSPVVDRVELAYVTPNMKPLVTALRADLGEGNGGGAGARPGSTARSGSAARGAGRGDDPQPRQTVPLSWEASDPNGDRLLYQLEYRLAGSDKWLPLAKDLNQPSYEWNTRLVADGRYQVRLTASDQLDNPLGMVRTTVRLSDPLVVDNAPPQLVKGPQIEHGNDRVSIAFTAQDNLTPLREVGYMIDSDGHWLAALPVDLIFDSTREEFLVSIDGLAPGPHVVSLRVVDSQGNSRYEAVTVQAGR